MMFYSFAERTEYNTQFGQILLESRLYRNTVNYSINGYTGQSFLLFKGMPSFSKVRSSSGSISSRLSYFAAAWSSIIDNILVIDFRNFQVAPIRAFPL